MTRKEALEYVANMTAIDRNGDWIFKQGYDPQIVLDALDAAQDDDGWRPIETVPDGEHVLLWFPNGERGIGGMECGTVCQDGEELDGAWTHGGPNAGSDDKIRADCRATGPGETRHLTLNEQKIMDNALRRSLKIVDGEGNSE